MWVELDHPKRASVQNVGMAAQLSACPRDHAFGRCSASTADEVLCRAGAVTGFQDQRVKGRRGVSAPPKKAA